MDDRPFHHGNLRAALLDHAESVLRDSGTEGLSLRDLARRAGVSHGAPRSHFVDRRSLLDALAVRGFERLTERVRAATEGGGTLQQTVRGAAQAYVDLAVHDAALMEVMFAAKGEGRGEGVDDAAADLFSTFAELLDRHRPDVPLSARDRQRFGLLFATLAQGTASLVGSHRVSAEQGAELVEDATTILVEAFFGAAAVR